MTLRKVGFGCMRLSTDSERDEGRALQTILAAVDAGATLLDTAPSYAQDGADLHHNERLVARALAARPDAPVEVSTKGGLTREGRAWVTDGRAKAIRASCEASREALQRAEIDLFLLHTVDPKVPLATSARALDDLLRAGLVRRVGLSNVNVTQIEEARRHVAVSAVQIAAGANDDAAFRGGVVRHCLEQGIEVYAHSPFGGPKKAPRLARDRELTAIGELLGTNAYGAVIAWLRSEGLVALPGARDPERAREAVRAACVELSEEARERLVLRLGRERATPAPALRDDGEVVVVMGVQGAGKSRLVEDWVRRGYDRLNRDEIGGTLRGLSMRLDERATAGGSRFVLDNTYTTRASRADVLGVAARHGLPVRCVFVDTPIEKAQVHAVERLAEKYGHVPLPEELRVLSKKDPHAFGPTAQLRARRELEPPSSDEGFSTIEHVPFERLPRPWEKGAGIVAELRAWMALSVDDASALRAASGTDRVLVFAWEEGASAEDVAAHARGAAARASFDVVDVAVCTHAGGPPTCWCRPPLPGLIVPWLRNHEIAPSRSTLVGSHASHLAMAKALGFGVAKKS